jgi:hypothetical protein
MPVPVLSPITSINAVYVGRSWDYQPNLATGSDPATSWAATGLPPGMTINATTGLIGGVPTEPGVFVVNLTATNGSGTSIVMVFPIGVAYSALAYDGAVLLNVNMQTGAVLRPGGKEPVLFAKSGDKFLAAIGFVNDSGTLQELTAPTSIKATFKAYDDEQKVELNNGLFVAQGNWESRRYLIALDFTSPIVAAALSDVENPKGTGIIGLAEIEWTCQAIIPGELTVTELPRSSWNFPVTTYRQLNG